MKMGGWLLLVLILIGYVSETRSADQKSADAAIVIKPGPAQFRFIHISPAAYQLDYPDFYMLETEVTNRQFFLYTRATDDRKNDFKVVKAIADQEKRNTRVTHRSDHTVEVERVFSTGDIPYSVTDAKAIWRHGSYPKGLDDYPVALVTLGDAQRFCAWLNKTFPQYGLFRLPTWNEWMVAAYGNDRAYPWGRGWDPARVHMSIGVEAQRAEPVRARPLGRTPEGLFGMFGNVAEYICDSDPTNKDYVDLEARWMGGGFTEGPTIPEELDHKEHRLEPRLDYWGYTHSSLICRSDLGFRVVLDPARNSALVTHKRLFDQQNKEWSTEKLNEKAD